MANPRTVAKLEARIHERVSHCLQFEVSDPRAGMITLTGVKLTSDLGFADVRYTVLGGASERTKAEHMLASAAGFIQRQVGRVLSMRRTPTLRFHYDASLEEALKLDRLIAGALERDRRIQATGHADDADAAERSAEDGDELADERDEDELPDELDADLPDELADDLEDPDEPDEPAGGGSRGAGPARS